MTEYYPEFNHFIRRLRSIGHTGEGISILIKGDAYDPDVYGSLKVSEIRPGGLSIGLAMIEQKTGATFKWHVRHGAGTMRFVELRRTIRQVLVVFDRSYCEELEDYVHTVSQ